MSSFLHFIFISLKLSVLNTANLQNQCFDSDPLGYCAELDTSVTITSLLNEMRYFDMTYQFQPYGMIYNISVVNSSNSDQISSIYMIGTHKLTTTPQLQWDISTFFMELFINLTDDKHIFVEQKYDGIKYGLSIYDLVMANNASKYLKYINAIYDSASSPIQDVKSFIALIHSNSLHHKFSVSTYLGMSLRNAMSSEIQQSIKQYAQFFDAVQYKDKLIVQSMENVSDYWDLWVYAQEMQRDKMYKQQYQNLFSKYFDLMDSLLTYSFWYQDSNLYDTIFRWKQKSYFIFARWLFRAHCVQIERDNHWIEQLTESVINGCVYSSVDGDSDGNKCDNIVLAEVYHIERLIYKLEQSVNEKLNTNRIKFDVHRVKVDWLNHIDEKRDRAAIEDAVKKTVKAFVEDLELFVSWQSQT